MGDRQHLLPESLPDFSKEPWSMYRQGVLDGMEHQAEPARVRRVLDYFRSYFPCEAPRQCVIGEWTCGNCQVMEAATNV